jgi:hypothetical protein
MADEGLTVDDDILDTIGHKVPEMGLEEARTLVLLVDGVRWLGNACSAPLRHGR